ncbi:hypothetical protein LAZ67_13003294 [Cordylochernes scorpioides]|uniref:Uncharacterized protein n=1 Tax=Cordylochernes scorpioides TaxID=51811 RepID=A0ABY6L778_9ARAC|nr:hypothetical protein LAZ67_13003294 [Cordylochernes scorpioides]
MAASDMRYRRHVQPLLTWSTNAAHPISLDQEPLQGTISWAQLNPGFLTPCVAAPNMEYKRCSSCISGSGALTGYYQPGQLSPGFFSELVTAPPPPFSSGLGTGKGRVEMYNEVGDSKCFIHVLNELLIEFFLESHTHTHNTHTHKF